MEFFLYIWEKSERIGLTVFLIIISLFATWYARYEATAIPNPNDYLDGTLIAPSHWFMKGMWYLTLAALVLHVGRRVWMRVFQGE
jgi:hypothetical protein